LSLPVTDWQFWVVTLLALGAAWYILREVLPFKFLRRKPKGRAASLTIEGKTPKS